jgi:hypothetical protein
MTPNDFSTIENTEKQWTLVPIAQRNEHKD